MAAEGIFRCIFEGCISGLDSGIERRPYHKNCGCALHDGSRKSQKNQRRKSCRHHGSSESISFPIRRSWSEGNIMAMNFATSSSSSSSNLQSLSSSSSLSNLTSFSDLPVDAAASEDQSRSHYHHHKLGWKINEDEDV